MNKTITINLSGLVFHIDENAYEELRRYLENLKLHFSTTEGRDEIIADIENRIAEMFAGRQTDSKQVITMDDIKAVTAALGNPQEISGEEEQPTKKQATTSTTGRIKRRFYRNPDDKILGGVCGGVGSYFDVDPIWFRLAFAMSVIFAGTGIFIYIILWLIIPSARTTSEKLEMRGEKVNVSTIEKNVREELGAVKQRLETIGKELSSDENKQRMEGAARRTGSFITEVLKKLIYFIAKLFGILITIISVTVLVTLSIAVFTLIGVFSTAVPFPVVPLIMTQGELLWMIAGIILLLGIPFTVLLLNGIKILFRLNLNLKKISAFMLVFWLIGLGICIVNGMAVGRQFSRTATVSEKAAITGTAANNIRIELYPSSGNELSSRGSNDWNELFYMDDDKASEVFIRDISLEVEKSESENSSLVINKESRGRSGAEARELAENIQYQYAIQDSVIKLSPACAISTAGKYRAQEVHLLLRLPLNKVVYIDRGMNKLLAEMGYDMPHDNSVVHSWKMTEDGLECIDCEGGKNIKNGDKGHSHSMRHVYRISFLKKFHQTVTFD